MSSKTAIERVVVNEQSKKVVSALPGCVLKAAFIVLLVAAVPLLWATEEPAEPNGGSNSDNLPQVEREPPKYELPSRTFEHLDIVTNCANHACKRYGWVVMFFVGGALIKLLLVGESIDEVVACELELLAFILAHTVEMVRYCAHGLRRLARQLRLKRKASSSRASDDRDDYEGQETELIS